MEKKRTLPIVHASPPKHYVAERKCESNGSWGGVLNYGIDPGGSMSVLKARVSLSYISASFITAPLCAPHTCKAAF